MKFMTTTPTKRRRVSGPMYFLGRSAEQWRAALSVAGTRHRTRTESTQRG
jgi:hypothetical protein